MDGAGEREGGLTTFLEKPEDKPPPNHFFFKQGKWDWEDLAQEAVSCPEGPPQSPAGLRE